jgi:hypothetical protein
MYRAISSSILSLHTLENVLNSPNYYTYSGRAGSGESGTKPAEGAGVVPGASRRALSNPRPTVNRIG